MHLCREATFDYNISRLAAFWTLLAFVYYTHFWQFRKDCLAVNIYSAASFPKETCLKDPAPPLLQLPSSRTWAFYRLVKKLCYIWWWQCTSVVYLKFCPFHTLLISSFITLVYCYWHYWIINLRRKKCFILKYLLYYLGVTPILWIFITYWSREWQPTPLFVPGKIHGQESGGLQFTGWQRVGPDWATEHEHTAQQFFKISAGCTTSHESLSSCLAFAAAAAAKSFQSYRALCDPINGSPPGSPIPGIL